MIKYHWNGHMQRIFVCDACGRETTDSPSMRLLREVGALPEEPSFYVHVHCIARFIDAHGGCWEQFTLSSETASWYI